MNLNLNLKKCSKIDLGNFSKCRRVGQREERNKGNDFDDTIKYLKDLDDKENLKLVMVSDQDVAEIKMLAKAKVETAKVRLVMVTDEEVDNVDQILKAGLRPKKRATPALVADEGATEVLEAERKPNKTKCQRVVPVMVTEAGVDKIVEAGIRAKNKVIKPTMVTDVEVDKILNIEAKPKQRVMPTMVTDEEAAEILETETRQERRVRLVMVTDGNEIKPPKMVANDLSIPGKESTKKVKLVVVSDGEVDEMKETAMSNNASTKELGKRVKAEIRTTRISIEIQKLGEKTSLERRPS